MKHIRLAKLLAISQLGLAQSYVEAVYRNGPTFVSFNEEANPWKVPSKVNLEVSLGTILK